MQWSNNITNAIRVAQGAALHNIKLVIDGIFKIAICATNAKVHTNTVIKLTRSSLYLFSAGRVNIANAPRPTHIIQLLVYFMDQFDMSKSPTLRKLTIMEIDSVSGSDLSNSIPMAKVKNPQKKIIGKPKDIINLGLFLIGVAKAVTRMIGAKLAKIEA